MVKTCKLVHCDKSKVRYLYAHTFHNFLYKDWESFAVCFNFWGEGEAITIGTVVHEINHAANRLMLSRDFMPDWNNDEADCYLKGWMADEVAAFMKQCKLSICV